MRERARGTVSEPDGGSQNGSGRCGGVLSSRRNRLRRENPPPTRQAPPPAAARPSPAPGQNRRNHAFSAAAASDCRRGRSWRNACCAPRHRPHAVLNRCGTHRIPTEVQYIRVYSYGIQSVILLLSGISHYMSQYEKCILCISLNSHSDSESLTEFSRDGGSNASKRLKTATAEPVCG